MLNCNRLLQRFVMFDKKYPFFGSARNIVILLAGYDSNLAMRRGRTKIHCAFNRRPAAAGQEEFVSSRP